MIRRLTAALAVALGVSFSGGVAQASGGVTLEQAMGKALTQHPVLSAARAEIGAREGAEHQAGLLPNPEVELEIEELGAPGGSDALETTLSLGQGLELGGKRPKRREAARLETALARTDLVTQRLDLEADVGRAFVEALAAQEKAKLQEELVGIAAETLKTVEERVRAGKVSPIEEIQAKLEMTASRIELRRSWAEWGAARTTLAGTWGGSGEELPAVEGRLDELSPLPAYGDLAAALPGTPDLQQWDTRIELGQATHELERASGIPDLGVTGGLRTLGDGDETTFLVAVSMPLPLFDRNQGAVAEAAANLARTRAERQVAERVLRGELEGLYQEIVATREEAEALRDTLVPGALQAYEAIREGYQWGKFEYLALLEAQRTLLEARAQLVEASAAFHLARVRLVRLTARTADPSTNP